MEEIRPAATVIQQWNFYFVLFSFTFSSIGAPVAIYTHCDDIMTCYPKEIFITIKNCLLKQHNLLLPSHTREGK